MGLCTLSTILQKLETTYGAAPYDKVRGHDGPIKLKRGPATNPLFKSFFNAGVEAGYHKTADVNGYNKKVLDHLIAKYIMDVVCLLQSVSTPSIKT